MMENKGYKQAVIAYKKDQEGYALDIQGARISASGKRQAIATMEGYTNPDVNRYEVELVYKPHDFINGTPSIEYNTNACPVDSLVVNPKYIRFAPSKNLVNVKDAESSLYYGTTQKIITANVDLEIAVTGFTYVKPNTTYTVSGGLWLYSNMPSGGYFTNGAQLQTGQTGLDNIEFTPVPGGWKFTTPNEVYKIAINLKTTSGNIDAVQIEEGEEVSAYEHPGEESTKQVELYSGSPWYLSDEQGADNSYIDYYNGSAGGYNIQVAKNQIFGVKKYVFRNVTGKTAALEVANLPYSKWVLLDGTWDNLGTWYNLGIWKY